MSTGFIYTSNATTDRATIDEQACLERCIRNNMDIAMAGTVEIINVLLINDTMKFELDDSEDICLRDIHTRRVLTSIPKQEVMQRAGALN